MGPGEGTVLSDRLGEPIKKLAELVDFEGNGFMLIRMSAENKFRRYSMALARLQRMRDA